MKRKVLKIFKVLGITLAGFVVLLVITALNPRTLTMQVDGIRLRSCDDEYAKVLKENGLADSTVGIEITFHRAHRHQAAVPFLPGWNRYIQYKGMQIQSLELVAEDGNGRKTVLGDDALLPLISCVDISTFLHRLFLRSGLGSSEDSLIRSIWEPICETKEPFNSYFDRLAATKKYAELSPEERCAFEAMRKFVFVITDQPLYFFGSRAHFYYSYKHGIVSDWYKEQLEDVTFFVKYPYSKSRRFHAELTLESGATFTASTTMYGWGAE